MFSSLQPITSKFKMYAGKLTIAVSAIALSILVWSNPLSATSNTTANAETISNLPFVVAISGVSEQVEGKAQKDIGTVKRNIGKVTGQAEGALDQAQGKAKQDIGTTKNKLDDAKDTVEDKSESLVDSVKDLFN